MEPPRRLVVRRDAACGKIAFAEGVKSFDMMKRAGEAAAALISQRFRAGRALVLCGPGNNGGDGFIIATALNRAGWEVSIASMKTADDLDGDAQQAAKNWWGKISTVWLRPCSTRPT